ncbi:MAG: RnfABCDGE type electron transport complex subunit D [Bacteroidales bacterium]|jgi:electron transport complex protein RnfD|nr:RnfABCDGE type electron transport complex subunit D [Bacteroidales bacterium]
MNTLTVSGSPHVQSGQTTKGIMWSVVIALLPAFLTGIYFFGFSALWVTLISVASCVLVEWTIQKYLLKGELTINDGSAVITGMLLAFNLPANVPLWIVVIGAVVAMGVGKMSFGGLGKNPFNPALVGRVFVFLSFPSYVAMSQWVNPQPMFGSVVSDAITGATPLALIKQHGQIPDILTLFFGKTGGSFGEVSALAILIGGIFLMFRKVITWHIPVSFIGTAAIFAAILWVINPQEYVNPLIHILAGGMMLGAVFMATDMTTSPTTKLGQIIFGAGCGILTMLFRSFGPMPEGVSFAILIMNAVTPLINKGIKPKRFGH